MKLAFFAGYSLNDYFCLFIYEDTHPLALVNLHIGIAEVLFKLRISLIAHS